jgi:propanediol dehydratase small subunit
MSTEIRPSLPWILPAVWQVAPLQDGFMLTPEQHRRRAQDMRDAGRPDLAQHHENCALIIERRHRRMH